jgi:hypothetical protein
MCVKLTGGSLAMESFGSLAKGLVTGKMVEDMLGTIKRGARGRCWCRSNTRLHQHTGGLDSSQSPCDV